MTASVLNFTPCSELDSLENLEAFVALCRNSEILNAKKQFHKNVWDVGYLKGKSNLHRAVFSTLEAASDNKPEPSLPYPFLEFAKAALIYLQDKRPVMSQAKRVVSFRCLEAALRHLNKGSRPTAVDEMVLDSAVEYAKTQMSAAVAHRIAGQLEYIAQFMCDMGFITLRQRWTHGVKSPQQLGSRISIEALTARQEKLPSAATLRALGGIFNEAIEPGDVVVSSNAALMLCAPERINELLRLRRNCLVEGETEYAGKLGLRWSGSKGFEDTTKWLPTEMAPVARQAIANLIRVTTPAQQLAAWYTENPTRIYLHEGAEHLRDYEVLTPADIAQLLWGDETAFKQAACWARIAKNLRKLELGGQRVGFFFKDVERAVIGMLPKTFPYVPGAPKLLCQDSMAIIRTNELHLKRAKYLCMFSYVDYMAITGHFGIRTGRKSIFERLGYVEDDGSPIKLRSHSLRHYLNMLAQTGGLSSTEIALFSGRKDVRQNRAYDHMTSEEVQAPITQALKDGFTSELEPVFQPGSNLITRNKFRELGLAAAHTTEYGWCAHDFASEPCQMYRDCINCAEQICIKGEEQKEANLRMLKSETEYLLKQAREALSDEEYGADTWVRHQSTTLERIIALLAILDDPAIAGGTQIRLETPNARLIRSGSFHAINVIRRKVTA